MWLELHINITLCLMKSNQEHVMNVLRGTIALLAASYRYTLSARLVRR
jgi:hypothetical protein